MGNIFCSSDFHFAHYNVVLHCNRTPWMYPNKNFDKYKKEHFKFNNPYVVDIEQHDHDLIKNWNNIVSSKDEVIILGDFAWKNHAHYIHALKGKKILIKGNHDKMNQDCLRLFSDVRDIWYTKIDGQMVQFSHCPFITWFSSCHGSWNLHGHCHGRNQEYPFKFQFDVGVDAWNYQPVPWDIIVKKMKYKEQLRKSFFKMKNKEEDTEEIDDKYSGGEDEYVRKIREFNMSFMKEYR